MNKTKFNLFIDLFSKLTTAIFIVSSIYSFCFRGMNGVFSLKYIWGVLGLSFMLSALRMLFFIESEQSKKKVIVYNVLYFVLADIVVLLFGFFFEWFSFENPATLIGMQITFVTVSVIVWFSVYCSLKHSADKMNKQLKKLQNEK